MTLPFAAADALRYLALACLWTLAGRALLSAAGQRGLGISGWLLAPIVAQASLAVALGMAAALLIPIELIVTPLWIGFLALAMAGLVVEIAAALKTRTSEQREAAGSALVLAIAAIVPTVVVLPYFVHGFGAVTATSHPDAWSYTVFGAYLSEYPRLTHGGLAPAYQWAYPLSRSRFVAPASLAWLAPATSEGDTQAAFGMLLALSTFMVGCTVAATGRILGLPNRYLLPAAIAGGAGNWIANAILVSNLDNLLALSYLPALAALGLDDARTPIRGRVMVASLLVAGATYTYPEFAAIGVACAGLYFARWPFIYSPRPLLVSVALGAGTTVILVWPYMADLIPFLLHQTTLGTSSGRPAAFVFRGLLDPVGRLDALWGLGAEELEQPTRLYTKLLAAFLCWLLAFGVRELVRHRALAALATLTLVAAGFTLFAGRFEYGYGAYKFILLGWWLVTITVLLGVRELFRVHLLAGAIAALFASAVVSTSVTNSLTAAFTPPGPSMSALREVRDVERLAHGAPIAIAVADTNAAYWATYYLRDWKTRLVARSGYLAVGHVQGPLDEAEPVPWSDLRLLLTDATDGGPFVEDQSWKRIWQNSRYALWDTGDAGWAVVWSIDNGYPYAASPNFLWVGDKPVTIVATANTSGIATVHAGLSLSQPLPTPLRPVRVAAAGSAGSTCEWTITEGGASLSVGLLAGNNVLTLSKTSPIDVAVAPNADQRHPFMIALVKPTFEFSRGAADVRCP